LANIDYRNLQAQVKRAELAQKWFAEEVSRRISEAGAASMKAIASIEAQVYAEMLSKGLSSETQRAFIGVNSAIKRDEMYRRTLEDLGKGGFKLSVNSGDSGEALAEVAQHISIISVHLKGIIREVIYNALLKTFEGAWSGLTEYQFPTEYKLLTMRVIQKLKKENAIEFTPGGRDNYSWSIVVNFEKMLGDSEDYYRGWHFGMMTSGASSSGAKAVDRGAFDPLVMPEMSSASYRVKLPYRGQAPLNPPHVRYSFWRALWYNQTYIAPGGKTSTEAAKASRTAHYQKQISEIDTAIGKMRKHYAQPSTTYKSRLFGGSTSNIGGGLGGADKIREQKLMMRRFRLQQAISNNHPGFAETPVSTEGLRELTINARCKFWESINKAPFWLDLEWGQLKSAPMIPPKGIILRFRTLLMELFDEAIRLLYKSRILGYSMDPSGKTAGRTRLAAGVKTQEIWFGGQIKPSTKPGGFLPKGLVDAERRVFDSLAVISREAAMASAPKFALPASKISNVTFGPNMTDWRVRAGMKSGSWESADFIPYNEFAGNYARQTGMVSPQTGFKTPLFNEGEIQKAYGTAKQAYEDKAVEMEIAEELKKLMG
jgi:hypothetical protein